MEKIMQKFFYCIHGCIHKNSGTPPPAGSVRLFYPLFCFFVPEPADEITDEIRTSARKNPGEHHAHRRHAKRHAKRRVHVRAGQHTQQHRGHCRTQLQHLPMERPRLWEYVTVSLGSLVHAVTSPSKPNH